VLDEADRLIRKEERMEPEALTALAEFREAHAKLIRVALKLPFLDAYTLYLRAKKAEDENEEALLSELPPEVAGYLREGGWGATKKK